MTPNSQLGHCYFVNPNHNTAGGKTITLWNANGATLHYENMKRYHTALPIENRGNVTMSATKTEWNRLVGIERSLSG